MSTLIGDGIMSTDSIIPDSSSNYESLQTKELVVALINRHLFEEEADPVRRESIFDRFWSSHDPLARSIRKRFEVLESDVEEDSESKHMLMNCCWEFSNGEDFVEWLGTEQGREVEGIFCLMDVVTFVF